MTKTATFPWKSADHRNVDFALRINKLNLMETWNYVKANNKPDAEGDALLSMMHYHSTEHMRQVTVIALWLLERESEQAWQYDVGALPLAVACMFHDMNHSLGKTDDEQNVAVAQEAFKKYLTDTEDQRIIDQQDIILELIKITQFPYMDTRQPKNLIERCIRDADILYGMQDDVIDYVMFSLRRELNRRPKTSTLKYDREQWASMRIDFLLSIEIYTPTAEAIMGWELSSTNDNSHEDKLQAWVSDDPVFYVTTANALKANDVLFIDTSEDATTKRRLIERITDMGVGFNIYFNDGDSLHLRNGEKCVAVERRK